MYFLIQQQDIQRKRHFLSSSVCKEKIIASPPPFLFSLGASLKCTFGGTDSNSTAALLFISSQVSVRNNRSRLCCIIRSLIRRDVFDRDLTLNHAALMLLDGCCGVGLDCLGNVNRLELLLFLLLEICFGLVVILTRMGLYIVSAGHLYSLSAWQHLLVRVPFTKESGHDMSSRRGRWSRLLRSLGVEVEQSVFTF